MKIILLGCSLKEMINFRGHVIDWLLEQEHELFILAPVDTIEHLQKYNHKKITFISAEYSRGIHPKKEIEFLSTYKKHLRQIRPDIVFSYSLKASLYSMIAHWRNRNVYFITGLGSGFVNKKYKYLLKTILLSFRFFRRLLNIKKDFFVFLNPDDAAFFVNNHFCKKENALVFPGEGINTEYFQYALLEPHEGPLRFLFIGRFIKDKGVLELTTACKRLKENAVNFKCTMIAPVDKSNPTGLSLSGVDFQACGIDYIPEATDVRPYIKNHDVIVLPSYAEGLPRVLLEAMAMGRPIIATNVNGCRELVDHDKNGLLIKPRDVDSLYDAMKNMEGYKKESLIEMGRRGRQMILEKYSVDCVVEKYRQLIAAAST